LTSEKRSSRAPCRRHTGTKNHEGLERCRAALLAWYRRAGRDLPWRASSDPYRVLVSELMLQQTRVDVVRERFLALIAAFPSVEAMAAASEDEVVAQWSGLGYYARARRLHAASREIVRRGGMPRTASALRELPGVGEYTAAAVASIAFGEAVATIDGNVERVLSRVLALGGDPRRGGNRARLRAAAGALLSPGEAGASNQALMELGALVCRPRSARCCDCPLASACAVAGKVEAISFPRLPSPLTPVRLRFVMPLVRSSGRLLLVRGGEERRWLRGLWRPPLLAVEQGDPWPDADGMLRRVRAELGLEVLLGQGRAFIRHAVTFRRLEIAVMDASAATAEVTAENAAWFTPEEAARLPASSLLRKALAALEPRDGLEGDESARARARRPRAVTAS
jgi:A/G-specific adenine glycosylase